MGNRCPFEDFDATGRQREAVIGTDTVVRQSPDSAAKVRRLSSIDAYFERTSHVEVIETHFAWVFLTDRHAYKLKKPIKADRLDHTSIAARSRSCYEELRLNRRLAPAVYESVMPLTEERDGSLALNGNGRVIDWLVKMKRLPGRLMLDRAMAAGAVDRNLLYAVGRLLAKFHMEQSPVDISSADYLLRIRRRIDELKAHLAAPDLGFPKEFPDRIHSAQTAALSTVAAELNLRPLRRGIIDAHGDLRPEHIYLGTPPSIIDALEFSPDLRMLDPIEDLSYLLIECAYVGHSDVGDAILSSYCACSSDFFSTRLLAFYGSLRAANRAKVVSWHLRDVEVRERQDWRQIAIAYMRQALRLASESGN